MTSTPLSTRKGRHWIAGPAFDLLGLIGPGLAVAGAVLLAPGLRLPETPVWAWALLVIGIDVAHVYAAVYRTYADPDVRRARPGLLAAVPAACFSVGVALHGAGGGALFWRALAYLAVFHFVRQQYGFVMLYRKAAGEGREGRWIDAAAVYAAMLYPLAVWHAEGRPHLAWFTAGDFVRLPALAAPAARALYAAALGLFAVRHAALFIQKRPFSVGKMFLVASTAASWYVGIIAFDSDLAFTATNVIAHGVPYFALVWLYGRRHWKSGWLERLHRPAMAAAFLLPLLLLAYVEEGLWDVLVWKEHAAVFFGLRWNGTVPSAGLHLLVPLLALPQAVHYVLDAWVWRMDGTNPGLDAILLTTGGRTAPSGD